MNEIKNTGHGRPLLGLAETTLLLAAYAAYPGPANRTTCPQSDEPAVSASRLLMKWPWPVRK
ncbi:hypothetical protein L0Y47_12260 [Ectopseudomonas composti]